eukprot:scaffold1177_cov126-Isochrysis_galbana.AAC.3
MAPRQLLLELEEDEMAAEKGSKRVRADSTNEGSMQVPVEQPSLSRQGRGIIVWGRKQRRNLMLVMTDRPADDA